MPKKKMKIVYIPIKDLNPAEYNPRQMSESQKDSLRESIETFGIVDPLIVNVNPKRENVIVGGHQRYALCMILGYEEMPCVTVNLSKKKERELNIRLNKNLGEWDWSVLSEEFGTEELSEWGFEDYEIKIDTDYDVDPNKEWEGMPDFENEDQTAFRSIIVNFQDQDGVDKFRKLTGQDFTDRTRSIWYPRVEDEKVAHLSYEDE